VDLGPDPRGDRSRGQGIDPRGGRRRRRRPDLDRVTAADAATRSRGWAARLPLVAPLAGRDFRLVWLGESVSLLGDQFNTVGLAWLGLRVTGPAFALSACLC